MRNILKREPAGTMPWVPANWFFWVALAVGFYYQIYRYPLDYGVEPPLFWRVGKYAILVGLCFLTSHRFINRIKIYSFFEWLNLFVFLTLGIFGYLQHEKFLVQAAFCALVAFWIVQSCNVTVSYRALLNFLLLAWIVNTLFYVFEWAGLVFFEKGFVHSSDSVVTSRFGGMLVEPLGAPYLSFIFVGMAFEFKGWIRKLILVSSVVAILMTHTFTAWLFLFLLVLGYAAFWTFKKIGRLASLALCVSAGLMVFGAILVLWYFKDSYPYLAAKWNVSILAHAEYWWPKRWPLLPTQESMFSETWWVMSVQSMGILWSITYVALMFSLLRACVRQGRMLLKPLPNGTWRGIYLGIFISGAFVIFGSMNQLYLGMYPVGFLFMLFCYMVKYAKISDDLAPGGG